MEPEDEEIEPRILLDEVRVLLNAYAHSTDQERSNQLVDWINSILAPLVEAQIPEALWLACSMPKLPEESYSDEDFDRRYWAEVRQAAEAGSIDAKFALAWELDYDKDTVEEPAALFKEAALPNHAYSQWCHGLNLIVGRGCEKNRDEGIRYIQLAAEKKFEGAIQWMANTLSQGTYGFEKDEEEASRWQRMLAHKDVIPY